MGFQFLFFQVLGFFSVRGPVANRSFRNVVVVFFFCFCFVEASSLDMRREHA